jgi:hypothetical protein
MTALAQVFGRRVDEPIHALLRPASEKRQGTKSRKVAVAVQRALWGFGRGVGLEEIGSKWSTRSLGPGVTAFARALPLPNFAHGEKAMSANAAVPRRFERHSLIDAQRPDSPAGAGGFEPLHFRIGIRQDSQPGRRDSNLCISKSSKRRIWTVSWSPQAVQ